MDGIRAQTGYVQQNMCSDIIDVITDDCAKSAKRVLIYSTPLVGWIMGINESINSTSFDAVYTKCSQKIEILGILMQDKQNFTVEDYRNSLIDIEQTMCHGMKAAIREEQAANVLYITGYTISSIFLFYVGLPLAFCVTSLAVLYFITFMNLIDSDERHERILAAVERAQVVYEEVHATLSEL